jgi:hypothetical protein
MKSPMVPSLRWPFALLLLAPAWACSSSGSDGGATGGATGGTGGAAASSDVGSGGAGAASGGATGTGGVGDELPTDGACLRGQCAPGYFCNWSLDACGDVPKGDDGISCDLWDGTCEPAGVDCEATTPVCGCDGEVHASQCAAQLAGADQGGWSCQAAQGPPGTFPCGMFFCDAATELCRHHWGDTCDHLFSCLPLDPQCEVTPGEACASCLLPQDCSDRTTCSCAETPGNGAVGTTVVVSPF